MDFFGRLYFGPREGGGVLSLKILHAPVIDQGLLAHIETKAGVPQKCLSRTFKIWIKIQRVQA